ncbi:MAG: DNA translocase FtsK, partial [Planctomycetes bacterium]|nr:DNA translocase FtsK [Planctomycetota bacterium]
FLFFLSFQSLLHFFLKREYWQEALVDGIGGGYFGYYAALLFRGLLGFWGGFIILIALLIISLILISNTSLGNLFSNTGPLAKFINPLRAFWLKLSEPLNKRVGEDEQNIYDDEPEEVVIEEEIEEERAPLPAAKDKEGIPSVQPLPLNKNINNQKTAKAIKKEIKPKAEKVDWHIPDAKVELPLDLLSSKSGQAAGCDIKANMQIIKDTLEKFGIAVEMGQASVGPAVTQYTFRPMEGIKLSRITVLHSDLALALAAQNIRIEAPIPGKSLVGVEVPNKSRASVGLREILDSKNFKENKGNLVMALGKDVSGETCSYDISEMPHLLVAGQTKSGKSVCLNTLILSLIYQHSPENLRFIMVDPKRVELPIYNGIPHLLAPVITEVNKTINALKWCLNEMDRRFDVLSEKKHRNIQSFNSVVKTEDKLPYIIFIIDELADLMMVAGKDIESSVIRLTQMSRAVGIHLVLATQRPSVNVITGLIKANIPARAAFAVASAIDSKTILDSSGAEKLLGKGDMLFSTAEFAKPKRIQGAFVSDQEIKRIINYLKERSGEVQYLEEITERQKVGGLAGVGLDGASGDEDELFQEAKDIVISMGKASTSLLQRRLRIGYGRAASILDMLEENGIITPGQGNKPREVLISKEQYESLGGATAVSGMPIHSRNSAQAPNSYLSDDEGFDSSGLEFASENEGSEKMEEETIIIEPDLEETDSDLSEKNIKNKKNNELEKEVEDELLLSESEKEEIEEQSEEEEIFEHIKEDEKKVQKEKKSVIKKAVIDQDDDNKPRSSTPLDDEDGMFFSK